MLTAETRLKKRVKRVLENVAVDYAIYYSMAGAGLYSTSGTADFILCLEGLYIAIETKPAENPLRPLQEKKQRDVISAKGVSMRITELDVPDLYQRLIDIAERQIAKNKQLHRLGSVQ